MDTLIPTLSIGMPVFNAANTLKEAIDSLLKQTYSDFELLISDNCSDDSTEEICRAFAKRDPRIRYFRQNQNWGAAHNFDFVIDQSRSEYFMWAASDDIWSTNFVERLLPISQGYRCLAIGRNQAVNLDGSISDHVANNHDINFIGHPMLRRLKYYIEPTILGSTNAIYGVFPKDLMPSISSFNFPSGDQFFIYSLLTKIEIRVCSDTIKFVRLHGNQSPTISQTFLLRLRYWMTLLPNTFISVIRSINFRNYWKMSSYSERIMLVLLHPIAFTRTASIILKREITR